MSKGDIRVHRLPVAIREGDVLHFLGYPEGMKPPKRTAERLDRVLEEARPLVEARGLLLELNPERAGEAGLDRMEASGLVLGLVTAGAKIEALAEERIREGDATAALMLEAAGSAAAEEAADRLGAVIAGHGDDGEGEPISCRISPGYGGWPLEAQRAVFDLLPHKEVGVELLPSMLMIPRKSISFAMWLGADAAPARGLSGCALCRLERCRYRRVPEGGSA